MMKTSMIAALLLVACSAISTLEASELAADKDCSGRIKAAASAGLRVELPQRVRDDLWREVFVGCRGAGATLQAEAHRRHGWYLDGTQREGDAQRAYQNGVDAVLAVAGPESAALAPLYDSLATIHARHGRNELALQLHSQALAIRERAFGPKSGEVALGLMMIGYHYMATEMPAMAETTFRRAWDISRVAGCGPDCSRTQPLSALFHALMAQPGREPEAELVQALLDQEDGETGKVGRSSTTSSN
jgi:hypothetical protein